MNNEGKPPLNSTSTTTPQYYNFFGLYNDKTQSPIPLKNIQVNAQIQDYIAEITYTQHYYNQHDTKLDTEYFFPLTSTACFHKFSAKFGTITVEGVVKEKEKARQEYQASKEKGDLVAYAEVSEENYNVMCIKLGNIPPQTEIQITFSYLERVEISLNKFWRFALYSALLPSKCFKDQNTSLPRNLADYPAYMEEAKKAPPSFKYDVSVVINSRTPITYLKSSSHQIETSYAQLSGIFSVKVQIASFDTPSPSQDFMLLYATDSLHKPSYLLSPYEKGYCALINFFPQINYLSFDDAYMASLEGKDVTEGFLSRAQCEYIFIIDRSSTMTKLKLTLAKYALQHFLKALPNHSYFNILSLDEPFGILGEVSILASEENIENTLKKLDDIFTAKGKTNIVEALEYVGRSELLPNFQRNVFLLTSGKADANLSQINYVIKNKFYKTRFFTLCLGDTSLTEFAKKAAIQGYGQYEVISNPDEVSDKVLHLLNLAAAPYFTDFELKLENENLLNPVIVPLPKSLSCITPNELVEFFVIFNKKLEQFKETKFSLKFYNGMNQRYEEYSETIDIANAEPSDSVVKLGISKFFEHEEKKNEIYEHMQSDIADAYRKDTVKKLLENSIKYGILTKYTAFICVVKEGDDIVRQIPVQQISMKTSLRTPTKKDEQVTVESNSFRDDDDDEAVRHSKDLLDEETPTRPSTKQFYLIGKETEEVKEEEAKYDLEPDKGSIPGTLEDVEFDEWQHVFDKGGDQLSYENITRQVSAPFNTLGRNLGPEKLETSSTRKPSKLNVFMPRSNTAGADEMKNSLGSPPQQKGKSIESQSKLNKNKGKGTLTPKMIKQNSASENTKGFGGLFSDVRQRLLGDKKKVSVASASRSNLSLSSSSLNLSLKDMQKMIELQNKEGYWEPKIEIGKLIQKKVEDLLHQIPTSLKDVKDKEIIWLTILILSWLEHYYFDTIEAKKYQKKAEDWLHLKGYTYVDYAPLAKKCLSW